MNEAEQLLADVGGTNVRIGRVVGNQVDDVVIFATRDFEGLADAVQAYMKLIAVDSVTHAAIAVANPVDGDEVRLTNADWAFSTQAVKTRLGLKTLLVVNDFTALAMALPQLGAEHCRQIGGQPCHVNAPMAVIGPGTGLGISAVIPGPGYWTALGSEGGHSTIAPDLELERTIVEMEAKSGDHVSLERLISGRGLERIYRRLCELRGIQVEERSSREIGERALAGSDAQSVEAVKVFSGLLGSAAGDLALMIGAKRGVFLGGGVVGRLGAAFDDARFRQGFEGKGRFRKWLEPIPAYCITMQQPTFLGLRTMLNAEIEGRLLKVGGTVSCPSH